ncbi:MAG: NAD(P)-dependent oxidoreductase [Bacteroidota bacterium]
MSTPLTPDTTRIAVLGLGAMGSRMAARLLAHSEENAGWHVTVWNRSAERAAPLEALGAIVAATPREASSSADLVIGMVSDDVASRALWLADDTGAVHGLRAGTVAITSSTLTPAWTRELGEAVAARGAHFLDAPVVGTRPHAENGILTFLVGGEAAALDGARPVLDVLGGGVHHIGPVGAGMTMKLAVNMLFAAQVATLADTMRLFQTNDLAVDAALDALGALPVTSPIMELMRPLMLRDAFPPNFPIALVEKDLRYFAEAAGGTVPTTEAIRAVYAAAIAQGFGEDDISGIGQAR